MPGTIQSVARAAGIVRVLVAAGAPLDLAEVAAAVGLAKTTTHGLLGTLREVGWVEQDRAGRYRAVAGLQGLAQTVDLADLRSVATLWMDRLAALSGLEVLLVAPEHGRAVVAQHVFRPDNSPQRLRVGDDQPLHATATGKLLLACCAPGQLDRPTEPLERFTPRTVTSLADLEAELAQVAEDGVAVGRGEQVRARYGVAVPVRDGLGYAVAALAVAGRREEVLQGDAVRAELVSSLRGVAVSLRHAWAAGP